MPYVRCPLVSAAHEFQFLLGGYQVSATNLGVQQDQLEELSLGVAAPDLGHRCNRRIDGRGDDLERWR